MAELSQPAESDEFGLLCPNCGYDLRGNPGERCSECGQIIDRALTDSTIPWVHRKHVGWVRAYLKTVWLVTIDSRQLRGQAVRKLKLQNAHRFKLITAVLLALAMIGVFVFVAGDLATFISEYKFSLTSVNQFGQWSHDLIVPWLAGITLPALLPAMFVGLAFTLTGVHRRLFRLSEAARQESATALACYAGGPLAWWLPVLGVECAAIYLDSIGVLEFRPGELLVMAALLTIALLMTLARITQWGLRVKRKSAAAALIDAPWLLLLWLWSTVVWLGILPWAIGFVWIVIDGFR